MEYSAHHYKWIEDLNIVLSINALSDQYN